MITKFVILLSVKLMMGGGGGGGRREEECFSTVINLSFIYMSSSILTSRRFAKYHIIIYIHTSSLSPFLIG